MIHAIATIELHGGRRDAFPDEFRRLVAQVLDQDGCWADEGWPCRSAFRVRFEPERRSDHIGSRVVLVKP